jgi:hypothetical protein
VNGRAGHGQVAAGQNHSRTDEGIVLAGVEEADWISMPTPVGPNGDSSAAASWSWGRGDAAIFKQAEATIARTYLSPMCKADWGTRD